MRNFHVPFNCLAISTSVILNSSALLAYDNVSLQSALKLFNANHDKTPGTKNAFETPKKAANNYFF